MLQRRNSQFQARLIRRLTAANLEALIPVVLVLLATEAAMMLGHTHLLQERSLFLLFFVAVAVSAVYRGLWLGLLATVLSTIVCAYFVADLIPVALFALVGLLTSVLTDSLYRTQKQAEADLVQAEAMARRSRILVEVGTRLEASLDYEGALMEVARMVVPTVADWCLIDILAEDGTLRRVALAHSDPLRLEQARQISSHCPIDLALPYGPGKVLPTGQSELHAEISDATWEAITQDGAYLRILRDSGLVSTLCVPLSARGHTLGTLTFAVTETQRHYHPVDLAMAQDLANRIALSLDNAHLYHAAQKEIAERRKVEEVLCLAKEEAERTNRAKSDFLLRMSHELRTPMNSILGFAQLLEMDALPPRQQARIDHILAAGQHLLELIDEILDLTRVEAGRLSLCVAPVDLADVLKEALTLVHPLALQRAITLPEDLSSFVGREALGDRQALRQVLLNLLSNAVKYNREGGKVEVEYDEAEEGGLRLTVADTGAGIAPENLERIFEPFERLGAERTGVQGTGLGLTLSRRFVEAMQGRLSVESVVGKGSRFCVQLLPAKRTTESSEMGEALRTSLPTMLVKHDGFHILYIEDNIANLQLVQEILADLPDVHLISTLQGSLGLDRARAHPTDLILLDLNLPDMGGEEVLRRLREDPATGSIPVVIISADATPGNVERFLASGAHHYFTKPLDVRKFLEVIARLRQETPAVE